MRIGFFLMPSNKVASFVSLLNFLTSPERADENTVKAIFLDHFTLEILSFCVNLNLLPLSYLYSIY